MADILPSYPPSLPPKALNYLLTSLNDYCLAHGITVRPVHAGKGNHLASHAPVTVFPSLFPRRAWEQAIKVQQTYNILYSKIANNVEWLGEIMCEYLLLPGRKSDRRLVEVDDFVRQLWELYIEIKKEGIAQPLSLGLFRSDYMIHADPSKSSPTPEIKQVEFNTISSSFGGLSSQVTQLHQYLYAIGAYGPDAPITRESLPDNPAATKLAAGLAAAHKAYSSSNAVILFIVQDPERNAFDQRWLEYHLLSTHGIQTRRHTLKEIAEIAKVDQERRLWIPSPVKGSEWQEISVVYLRAGYGPGDYPSQTEWEARWMLERSTAIKCPTVITQLAGCKKVQQVLASTGELERFLDKEEAEELRKTFTAMYPLDTSKEGLEARKLAFSNPEAYVLKPQREGGGNNIYRSKIPDFLTSLPNESHYNAYILMELIQPPPLTNSIIREGEVMKGGVIGELGVYGTILWDVDGTVLQNEEAGWLLRTKGKGVDEGGVAAGFGSVDSVCLV